MDGGSVLCPRCRSSDGIQPPVRDRLRNRLLSMLLFNFFNIICRRNIPSSGTSPIAGFLRNITFSGIADEKRSLTRFVPEGDHGMLTPLKLNSANSFFHFPELEKLTICIPHPDGGSEVVKIDRPADDIYAAPDVCEAVAAFKPFSAAFVSEPVPEV